MHWKHCHNTSLERSLSLSFLLPPPTPPPPRVCGIKMQKIQRYTFCTVILVGKWFILGYFWNLISLVISWDFYREWTYKIPTVILIWGREKDRNQQNIRCTNTRKNRTRPLSPPLSFLLQSSSAHSGFCNWQAQRLGREAGKYKIKSSRQNVCMAGGVSGELERLGAMSLNSFSSIWNWNYSLHKSWEISSVLEAMGGGGEMCIYSPFLTILFPVYHRNWKQENYNSKIGSRVLNVISLLSTKYSFVWELENGIKVETIFLFLWQQQTDAWVAADMKRFFTSHPCWYSKADVSINGNVLWFSNLGGSRNFSLSWTRASVVDLKMVVFYLPCLLLLQSFHWFYMHLFLAL